MVWLLFLLLLVVDIVGLVLAAFTLPGLWLMLGAAAVYALLTRVHHFMGVYALVALLLLVALSEVADIGLGGAGAKKAGGTGWGVIGALVGGILGGIFLTAIVPIPIIGTIAGICLGSFLGAFGLEVVMGQSVEQSARIGFGAAKGKLYGIVSKVVIGVVMLVLTFFTALPIHGRPVPPRVLPPVRVSTTTAAVR